MVVNFLATFLAIPLIAKIGRKPITITGFMIDNITLLAIAIVYCLKLGNPKTTENNVTLQPFTDPQKYVVMAFSIIYIICFEIAPGPLYYVCLSESLPPEVKGKMLGVGFIMVQLSYFIVVFTFSPIDAANITCVAYFMYFGITMVSTIMLWVYQVETRGRTFDEINALMIDI